LLKGIGPRSLIQFAVRRRNKWLCALKATLSTVKIHGPKGDPDALPAPARYTEVPWDLVREGDKQTAKKKAFADSLGVEERPTDLGAAICEIVFNMAHVYPS
jgi:hypothetical protein